MSDSYPRRDQARGIWKINDITKNIKELGTYPGAAKFMALCGGGHTGSNSNVIDEFNMITAGNAIDFGDLVTARSGCSSNSSNIRILWSGGETSSNFSQQDYVHFATKGNAADFGDLGTAQGNTTRGTGNEVKAVTSSGSGDSDLLQTFIFATLGSSSNFGNLTTGRNGAPQGTTNGVRGTYSGGMAPNESNVIDFIEITTDGNATDFGDLSVARGEASSADSKTRSVIFSGRTNTPSGGTIADVIDFFETASQGNAVNFGDMNVARKAMAGGLSNSIKGFSAGGSDGSAINSIEQITIATRSNGSDFGDLTVARTACPGNTSSHGGLQGFHPRAPELYSPTGKVVPGGLNVGDIGISAGSDAGTQTRLEYIQISTTGNAIEFGNLPSNQSYQMGAGGSSTRAIYGAQASPSSNGNTYIEYATKGNTAFFGNLSSSRAQGDALSNSTRIVFTAGSGPSNVLDYNTITTLGNATDFGDLNYSSRLIGATGGQTRGMIFGGMNEPSTMINNVSYLTIGSTGNATDFGDLTEAKNRPYATNSTTRAITMGGYLYTGNSNVIEYFTIASTGNGTDFGDLTVARYGANVTGTNVRGVAMGGADPSVNTIDYVTIASTGNATDFGDMTQAGGQGAAISNGHGGLS